MPRRCSCGAEFEWELPGGFIGALAAFVALGLFMSPFFFLIWISRSLLQDSIVLYSFALVSGIYLFRICETLLVRFERLHMKGIKVE